MTDSLPPLPTGLADTQTVTYRQVVVLFFSLLIKFCVFSHLDYDVFYSNARQKLKHCSKTTDLIFSKKPKTVNFNVSDAAPNTNRWTLACQCHRPEYWQMIRPVSVMIFFYFPPSRKRDITLTLLVREEKPYQLFSSTFLHVVGIWIGILQRIPTLKAEHSH